MRASLYVINKFFWKNKLNVFFAVFIPLMMVVLVTSVFTINFNIASVTTEGVPTVSILAPVYLIPGAATISIVCLTVLSLPLIVQEFKKTNTLKRLSMYRSGIHFFTAITLYYMILCYVTYVISFCIAALLITAIDTTDKESINYMVKNMHMGQLAFSIFLYSILAIGVGILFSMLCKNQNTVQILGIVIVLFVLFLGGAGIPLQYAAMYSNGKHGITLWTLTYFSIYRYPLMLILESCIQGPAFNAGNFDQASWEQFLLLGWMTQSESFVKGMGYTSIFDFNHSFITNLIPIPHITTMPDVVTGLTVTGNFDTWYLDQCSGELGIDVNISGIDINIKDAGGAWRVAPLVWSVYWSEIDLSGVINLISNGQTSMTQIPVFTFAGEVDKIMDLIMPFIIAIGTYWIIITQYKRKMIQN